MTDQGVEGDLSLASFRAVPRSRLQGHHQPHYPTIHTCHRLACQACHGSSHGLNPVTPDIDPTTYAQAASLNPDGSHGPIRCGACHQPVNEHGVPVAYADLTFRHIETGGETRIGTSFDLAVQLIHATASDGGGR